MQLAATIGTPTQINSEYPLQSRHPTQWRSARIGCGAIGAARFARWRGAGHDARSRALHHATGRQAPALQRQMLFQPAARRGAAVSDRVVTRQPGQIGWRGEEQQVDSAPTHRVACLGVSLAIFGAGERWSSLGAGFGVFHGISPGWPICAWEYAVFRVKRRSERSEFFCTPRGRTQIN